MIPTKDQEEALKDGKNFLVSASAGSGKTAVMIERIVNTLEKGTDITRLLVVTFTKAAAEEMKDKLLDELYKRIRNQNCKNAAHLRLQIAKLPFAAISTIDSFCLSVYRTYFADISGQPVFNVLDEEDARLLFRTSCLEVITESLEEGKSEFLLLFSKFTKSRNIDSLINTITAYHKYLDVQSNPLRTIDNAVEISKMNFSDKPLIKDMVIDIKKQAAVLTSKIQNVINNAAAVDVNACLSKYDTCLMDALTWLSTLSAAKNLKELCLYLKSVETEGLKHYGGNKLESHLLDLRCLIKESLSEYNCFICKLKDYLHCHEGENGFKDLEAEESLADSILLTFLDTVAKVRERYQSYKLKDGRPDFADLEHYTLKIFENKDRVEEIKNSIDFIFLDEYQDINYLQETIITKVSNDNVFMVGDVKQSIYGFRFAEPKIFIEKKDCYSGTKLDASYKNGKNVLLNENFRSAEGILNFVNDIFVHIMTEEFGQLEYKTEAMLKRGLKDDFPIDERLKPAYVKFFNSEDDESDGEDESDMNPLEDNPEVYSVLNGRLKKKPIDEESLFIADTIERIVGNLQIYDKKLGKTRAARYSDIAILMRNKKGKNIIGELALRNIPFQAEGFEGGDIELNGIKLLLNYLNVIDNYQNDLMLFSAMEGYFGGFSQNELTEIRKEKRDGFFWNAVINYNKDDKIKAKIDNFFDEIKKFRQLSAYITVDALINRIITDTGFDTYLLSKESLQEIECLNAFIYGLRDKDIAKSLSVFLEYYNNLDKIEVKLTPSGDDFVSFYSVHKSKGLEFPIVFLASCEQRLDLKSLSKQDALFDTELGIALKAKDEDEKRNSDTLSYKLMYDAKVRKLQEELIRLLYVGMTRARYHLFLTGKYSKRAAKTPPKEKKLEDALSFMQYIDYALLKNPLQNITDELFNKDVISLEKLSVKTKSIKEKEEQEPQSFIYKYNNARSLFNKYTVSEVNAAFNEKTGDKRIFRLYDTQSKDLGISYHSFLESFDYQNRTYNGILEQISDFENVNPTLKGLIDTAKVQAFLNSDIFKGLDNFTAVKEKPFLLYIPASEVFDGGGADKVLIQGTFDLLLLSEKKNVIVDFKLSGKNEHEIRNRYKEQLRLYTKAAEKLLNIKIDAKVIYVINQELTIFL